MLEVPVSIVDWVYECCGTVLTVGDHVDLQLSFIGDVQPSDGPAEIEILDDQRVRVVGRLIGPIDEGDEFEESGTIVESGSLRFGVSGRHSSEFVQCTGILEEMRHGFPSAATAGVIAELRRCAAIFEKSGEREWTVVGYEPGEALDSTSNSKDEDPLVVRTLKDPFMSGGRWVPYVPQQPEGWAFRLLLQVQGDV